jgi:hypothetical protein
MALTAFTWKKRASRHAGADSMSEDVLWLSLIVITAPIGLDVLSALSHEEI